MVSTQSTWESITGLTPPHTQYNTFSLSLYLSISPTNTHTDMAYKADPYADIDFDDVTEATGLAMDEIKCLKVCFDLFDTKKQDYLSVDDLDEIMRAMGFRPSKEELQELLEEIDEEGLGYITTETLRGLIGELLAPLTDEELDGIIEELDEDGSGSMDFDEFCEMMMTKPE